MFSKGQLVFALIFIVSFFAWLMVLYQRDKKYHKKFYKHTALKVLVALVLLFTIFIALRIWVHYA